MKWNFRASRCHRNTKQNQWEPHPLDFLFILQGMEGEITLYAYISTMRLNSLHPPATLCLSRGKEPTCAHTPQLGLTWPKHPLSRKPWDLGDEMSSANTCPSPGASTDPPRPSQNRRRLPSSHKTPLGLQPFHEPSQQIYGSSHSQLRYMNSSNASIKNPALPP